MPMSVVKWPVCHYCKKEEKPCTDWCDTWICHTCSEEMLTAEAHYSRTGLMTDKYKFTMMTNLLLNKG